MRARERRLQRRHRATGSAAGPHVVNALREAPGRRSVARNVGVLLASQLVTFSLAAVVTIVLPRALGPEGLGQLRLAASLWTIAAVIVAFGTPLLLVKDLARDKGDGGAVVGQVLLAQGLLFVAAIAAMAGFLLVAGYGERTMVVVAITGVGAGLYVFVNTARAALQGLERMEYSAAADISGKVAYVAVLVLLLWLGGDERAAAAAGVVQASVAVIVIYPLLRRFPGIRLGARLGSVRPVLRRSRPYLAIGATLVIYQQVDVIVISWLVDARTVGWYATADGLVAALYFVPVIGASAFLPHLSRLHQDDPSATLPVLRRAFGYLAAVAVPIGLGTVAIGQQLAVQLFGSRFSETGPVLVVMGVVLMLTHLTILLGQYSIAVDRQGLWTRMMVTVMVATVALDLVLVPLADRVYGNGAVGGALAYVATEGFLLIYGVARLAPRLLDAALVAKLSKCLLAGTAMMAAVWPFREGIVVVPVAVGGAAYLTVLAGTRFLDRDEVAAARSAVTAVLSRTPMRGAPAEGIEEDTHA